MGTTKGFIENINDVASKLSIIETATSIFDEGVIPVLTEIANLDLDQAVQDLKKGNYLGNRKIDINLSLNMSGITEDTPEAEAEAIWTNPLKVVKYSGATVTFVDGVVLEIPFTFDGNLINVSTHSSLLLQFTNNAPFLAKLEDTLISGFSEKVVGEIIRMYDVVGNSSNIERIMLHAVSGDYIEKNPLFYWAKSTSAFQTLSMRAGDIIKIGNEIDNIILVANSIAQLTDLEDQIPKLIDTFNAQGIGNGDQTLYNNLSKLVSVYDNLTKIIEIYGDIKVGGTNYIKTVSTNITSVNTVAANITAVINAAANATTASTKAAEASASATSANASATSATASATLATTKANEIKNVAVANTYTGNAGSSASVVYDSVAGKFTFIVPKGDKGDKGDAFTVNAVGLLSTRTTYDTQATGFSFLSVDTGAIYFKLSSATGNWSSAVPFGKGDKGDIGNTGRGIVTTTFLSTTDASGLPNKSGAIDTYKITYSDTTTTTFTVKNGIDSLVQTVAGRVGNVVITKADIADFGTYLTPTGSGAGLTGITKAMVGLPLAENTADNAKVVLAAAKWITPRTITLSGDVTGSVTMDGSANVSITATIAADSVALGTDTTGNFVNNVVAGTGITVTHTPGEGSTATITNNQPNVSTNLSTSVNTTSVSINSSDGTSASIPAATTLLAGVMTPSDVVKLAGIATDATANGTGTITGTSTGTNTGDQTSVSGNAGTATKLQTARSIGGVAFDGSANINLPGVNIAGNQSTSGNAATATYATTAGNANQLIGKNWNWSGQGGQPAWLWGGSDGANMYVYNPANFSVNYANSAGTAGNGVNSWNFTVRNDNAGHTYGTSKQYRYITAMNINGTVKEIVTGEYNCWSNCDCSSCFVEGQPVLMADGTYKNIEDVKVGDSVRGAYGEEDINIVTHLQRPPRGDREIYNVNGLLVTDEHGIVNGDRDGFMYMSLENHYKEANTFQTCIDGEGNEVEVFFAGTKAGNCKKDTLVEGKTIFGEQGKELVANIIETDLKPEMLYHLVLDGFSRTYSVSGKFVSGYADSDLFDYELGIKREVSNEGL